MHIYCVCVYLPGPCCVCVDPQWGVAVIQQHPQLALGVKGHIQGVAGEGQLAVGNQRLLLCAEEVERGHPGDTQGEWWVGSGRHGDHESL